ncbi:MULTISPECIES: LysR family transcriptional regulator [Streptomyces]|uniref:LysR family transcriptional regulator n=1 Tax=Streptomyces TaxID=1883 RepID=UPI00345C4FC6
MGEPTGCCRGMTRHGAGQPVPTAAGQVGGTPYAAGGNGAGSLSLRQLEYLVVAIGEGRLTRAAQRLHVTEPTMSQQLKALERAVGTCLLVRGRDGIRPTPAGEALLPHARTALCSAGEGRAAALAAACGHTDVLRVATLPALLDGLLPALRAWALARPDARLCVGVHESGRSLEESVASGAADLGIGPRPAGWCGQVWPWCTEELVVACAEDDPLRGETVSVRDLLGRRWIRCPDDGLQPVPPLATAADGSAAAGETTADPPPPVLDVPTPGAAVTLAASGTGIALAPLGSLPPGRRSWTIRLDPPATVDVTLFTAPDAPAATLAHAGLLRRCAAHDRVASST